MEVKTTVGLTLSLERYNEAVRLITLYSRNASSADVGVRTNSEAMDWLENVYGQPWQNCPLIGCHSNRKCLLAQTDVAIYGKCRGSPASGSIPKDIDDFPGPEDFGVPPSGEGK
jgi:hypothetical protein